MLSPVTTQADLISALQAAKPGDVVRLAGKFGQLGIPSRVYGGVTLAGPAVIAGLKASTVSGLTFTDLEFALPVAKDEVGSNANGVRLINCRDVHFRKVHVHGAKPGDPLNICGVSFSGCSNYSVENSELDNLRVAITQGLGDHAAFTGNHFHDIRIDGIDSTACSFVTIARNRFDNFHHLGHPNTPDGDHSDAIQFLTAGHPLRMRDITIEDNLIVQGAGEVMQGMQIQDESKGKVPFANVIIRRNTIIGGNWNGIHLTDCTGGEISDNTLACIGYVSPASIDFQHPRGTVTTPWVRLERCTGVKETNTRKPLVSDGGAQLAAAWAALR